MVEEIRGANSTATAGSDGYSAVAGPLVSLHVSLSRLIWRIGPAWSVFCGALVAGAPLFTADAVLRLVAAAALADLAWGMLRRAIPAQPTAGPTGGPVVPAVPYAQADSPLARTLGRLASWQGDSPGETRRALQELALGLAFTLLLSFLLPRAAFLLSAAAAGTVTVGWAWVRRGRQPAWALALLDVALPWLLGAVLAPGGPRSAVAVLLLGAGFTALQWGDYRWWMSAGERADGAWLGMAGVSIALILLRAPWAVAAVAALFLPAAWQLRRTGPDVLPAAGRSRVLPWWWAAMLLTAIAAR